MNTLSLQTHFHRCIFKQRFRHLSGLASSGYYNLKFLREEINNTSSPLKSISRKCSSNKDRVKRSRSSPGAKLDAVSSELSAIDSILIQMKALPNQITLVRKFYKLFCNMLTCWIFGICFCCQGFWFNLNNDIRHLYRLEWQGLRLYRIWSSKKNINWLLQDVS